MSCPATMISIGAKDSATATIRRVANEAEGLCRRLDVLGRRASQAWKLVAGTVGVTSLVGLAKESQELASRYEFLGLSLHAIGERYGYTHVDRSNTGGVPEPYTVPVSRETHSSKEGALWQE